MVAAIEFESSVTDASILGIIVYKLSRWQWYSQSSCSQLEKQVNQSTTSGLLGGEMLSVSEEAGGHVIWSRGQSRNQLRLISKRWANNFSQRADDMIILRGRRSRAGV